MAQPAGPFYFNPPPPPQWQQQFPPVKANSPHLPNYIYGVWGVGGLVPLFFFAYLASVLKVWPTGGGWAQTYLGRENIVEPFNNICGIGCHKVASHTNAYHKVFRKNTLFGNTRWNYASSCVHQGLENILLTCLGECRRFQCDFSKVLSMYSISLLSYNFLGPLLGPLSYIP